MTNADSYAIVENHGGNKGAHAMTSTAQETPYQRWYRKNRETFNARRRKRYKDSTSYRETIREKAREKRRENRVEHPGTPTNEAAAQIGRTAQTILDWEKRGLIPKATILVGNKRRYTEGQIALMNDLSEVMATYFVDRDAYYAELPAVTSRIKECWNASDH